MIVLQNDACFVGDRRSKLKSVEKKSCELPVNNCRPGAAVRFRVLDGRYYPNHFYSNALELSTSARAGILEASGDLRGVDFSGYRKISPR